MDWLEHEQTIRARQGLGANAKPNEEASKAINILLGLGWKSQHFDDVAAGLRKKEQQSSGAGPLRKIINKGK